MKKLLFKILTAAFLIAVFGSCNDPIFYMVSKEPPKVEPLIEGSPVNYTIFKNEIYVASGEKIYKYNGSWAILSPSSFGKVIFLASTENFLYAVCLNGSNGVLKRSSSPSKTWETVSTKINNSNIQTAFSVTGGGLFICSRNSDTTFQIYYSEDGDNLDFKPVSGAEKTSLLRGVAAYENNFLLCAGNIYNMPDDSSELKAETIGSVNNFMGIIDLGSAENRIAAINRDGNLYIISLDDETKTFSINNANKRIGSSNNQRATGAVALWTNNSRHLLLVGRQDMKYSANTGYTHGYVEIEIDLETGVTGSFREPGRTAPTTVSDYNTYVNSIGKNPINYIIQTPESINSEMIIFASTQANGVWRLKNDQWNHQEK